MAPGALPDLQLPHRFAAMADAAKTPHRLSADLSGPTDIGLGHVLVNEQPRGFSCSAFGTGRTDRRGIIFHLAAR